MYLQVLFLATRYFFLFCFFFFGNLVELSSWVPFACSYDLNIKWTNKNRTIIHAAHSLAAKTSRESNQRLPLRSCQLLSLGMFSLSLSLWVVCTRIYTCTVNSEACKYVICLELDGPNTQKSLFFFHIFAMDFFFGIAHHMSEEKPHRISTQVWFILIMLSRGWFVVCIL